jgi:hypothetical protein
MAVYAQERYEINALETRLRAQESNKNLFRYLDI